MTEPVKAGDLIAVYGLLRQGASAYQQFDLARAFTPLGPCVLGGTLHDLGDYPGLVPGDGRVVGELFRIDEPGVMTALDAFEKYYPDDPARSQYRRLRMDCLKPEGTSAWVYVCALPTEQAPAIAHGDWLRHVRQRSA